MPEARGHTVPESVRELLPDADAIDAFVTHLRAELAATAPPFDWDSAEAVGTFQRLADAFAADLFACSHPQRLVSRTRGRTSLDLWVPRQIPNGTGGLTATPAGVMVAPSRGILDSGRGVPLDLGDSMEVRAEAAVWVGPLPGYSEGYLCFQHCWNPRGGALDV